MPETAGVGETVAVLRRPDALTVLAKIQDVVYDASARVDNFDVLPPPAGPGPVRGPEDPRRRPARGELRAQR
ncbi:hypothetical protein [Sinomonas gamaensis]|uniref:hypothetical protein n=1 Tax=Sinomonas gamaensis TaxID=2565624 RepID=UPI001109521A|nr:hypothetical protein [Sinomonas gamaensis]